MKVFNIEFDGIDKSGKDSIMQQIFSMMPNKYIPKARGLISQIAYSKLYHRSYTYEVSEGYIDNTLFVYLTLDKDDWKVRCDISKEFLANKYRSDLEDELKYESNVAAFDYAYNYLVSKYGDSHFMRFNTSELTPYKIMTQVLLYIEALNDEG